MLADDDADTLELVEVPAKVREAQGLTVSYHRVWCDAVSGVIPAHRVDGRWQVLQRDLPRIAEVLSTPRPRGRAKHTETIQAQRETHGDHPFEKRKGLPSPDGSPLRSRQQLRPARRSRSEPLPPRKNSVGKIPFRPVLEQPQHAAPPHFFAGRLFRRLPARLADLPDDTRELIGKALDRRLVRLALDDDGGALVLRGIGR
jgi:hypothetical protein